MLSPTCLLTSCLTSLLFISLPSSLSLAHALHADDCFGRSHCPPLPLFCSLYTQSLLLYCSIRNLSGPCTVVSTRGPLIFPVPCFSLYQSSLEVFIFTVTYAMGLPFPFILLFFLFFCILKQYRIWQPRLICPKQE